MVPASIIFLAPSWNSEFAFLTISYFLGGSLRSGHVIYMSFYHEVSPYIITFNKRLIEKLVNKCILHVTESVITKFKVFQYTIKLYILLN